MIRILVSFYQPYTILDVKSNMYFVLGYRPEDLKCKSLDVILGPKSDTALLYQSIQAASESGMASQFQMMLYEQSGKCRNMQISCCRNLDDMLGAQTCSLSLELPSTIVVDEVYQDNTCGWALASSEWPHGIQMVNSKFTSEFGFSAEEATGLNLYQIITSASDSEDWRVFMGLAREGQRSQGMTVTLSKYGEQHRSLLSFEPVQTVCNGAIESIMVRFVSHFVTISTCGLSDLENTDTRRLLPAGESHTSGSSPSPPPLPSTWHCELTFAGRRGDSSAAPKRRASDSAIIETARPCPMNRRSEPPPAALAVFAGPNIGGGGGAGHRTPGHRGQTSLSINDYVRRLQRRHEAAERRVRRRQAPSHCRSAEHADAAPRSAAPSTASPLSDTASCGWPLDPVLEPFLPPPPPPPPAECDSLLRA